jgi:tungstate transport system substrate-binding protein
MRHAIVHDPVLPNADGPGDVRLSPESVMLRRVVAAAWLLAACVAAQAQSLARYIVVGSTHTTQDSGLLSVIAPQFTAATGIGVRFVIFGTGQVLDTGRRGDVDVVLTHVRADEERFVAEGYGVRRYPVMYNDFVLVGPEADPAGVGAERDVSRALDRLQRTASLFVSRGDGSGTHVMELLLWRKAGIDPQKLKGQRWYREVGQGMGAALNISSTLRAYVLTDRGTWLNFRNRGDLAILVENNRPLRNQYGMILVNPARHAGVRKEDGQAFIDWLTGPAGQAAIALYRINGEQVFFPNAAEPGS